MLVGHVDVFILTQDTSVVLMLTVIKAHLFEHTHNSSVTVLKRCSLKSIVWSKMNTFKVCASSLTEIIDSIKS